jgi:hypothetical protein
MVDRGAPLTFIRRNEMKADHRTLCLSYLNPGDPRQPGFI